ncbi:hypothetical protein [Asinibacterium sp. OR53]|uniref:hypothetical protein n=1 Tax=Asinibacterium sp. OR53 TaxID=925409 RepID=UPI00047EBC6A|nr:hypothetical protein [Asinibacterium sp. OR53]
MLKEYLEVYRLSIVVVGNFNPVIIQPFWLAQKKLIREQEAQDAVVEIIHPSIVKFKLDWCEFEIGTERMEVRTSRDALFDALNDLVKSIFGILKETPVKAVGLNHLLYYAMPDEERYYEVGNRLGGLTNWKRLFKDPRLFILDVGEVQRSDGKMGSKRIRVAPADIPLPTPYSLLVYINDHFDLSDGVRGLQTLLKEDFAESVASASEVPGVLWEVMNATK